jgi:hypothetical protein
MTFVIRQPSPLRYICFYCSGDINPMVEPYAEAVACLDGHNTWTIRGHVDCAERVRVVVYDDVIVSLERS